MKIVLPPHYLKLERDGWFLYYDPNNFVWIKVNRDGAAIIDNFREYSEVNKVVKELSSVYKVSEEEILSSVKNFLENNLKIGFFHKNNYKEFKLDDILPDCPRDLYLSVTNRCNLNCVYCYNKNDRVKIEDQYEMSYSEYLKVLKDAKATGIKKVVFTGGEPLLYPSLVELGLKVKNLGMTSELLTNAVLINNRNYKQIVKAFDIVTVSLDSHIKEIHESQRGGGTFEKAINALKILRQAGVKWIYAATVVTKENIKDIIEYYRFALDKIKVNRVINQICLPYDISGKSEDLMPTNEEIFDMEERIDKFMKSRIKEKVDQPLLRNVTCGAGTAEIGVSPNGDVFPCHTLQKKEFLCGNLRNQKLKEIYETSQTLKFFRNLTVRKIEKCCKCDWRHVCGGGCRSLALSISGKIDGYNHLQCEYLRNKAINRLWASSELPLDDIGRSNPKNKRKKSKGKGT